MTSTPGKPHPLMMVAAISVTVAALAAIGVMTGLLPGSSSEKAEVAPASVAQSPAPATPAAVVSVSASETPAVAAQRTEPAPAKPPVKRSNPVTATKTASSDGMPPPVPAEYRVPAGSPPPAPPICRECGTIESVREVAQQGQGTGLGAVAGGVLGGVLGHQVGSGRGNDLATVVGAVGGAVAGHQVEKSQRKTVRYEITVRMDDGTMQTISAESQPSWRGGERVKVANGIATPM